MDYIRISKTVLCNRFMMKTLRSFKNLFIIKYKILEMLYFT